MSTCDGDDTGSVTEDGTTLVGGTVAAHDVDDGEAAFQAVPGSALAGVYGDFTFDPSTDIVTWRAKKATVTVTFDWVSGGTYGACGFRKRDPNGVCLVATWQGAQVGGSRPGGGQDFGVRAIRLSN